MSLKFFFAILAALVAVAIAAPQYGHESSGYKHESPKYESHEPATSYQNVNLYPQEHKYEQKYEAPKYESHGYHH